MTVNVRLIGNLDDLASDLRKIPSIEAREAPIVVRSAIRRGNEDAKDNARRTSGTHAREYPGTFTAEMHKKSRSRFWGSEVYSGSYGPVARGQGELASVLERGSRNNPAHRDLAHSADTIAPWLEQEVRTMLDKLFWPES